MGLGGMKYAWQRQTKDFAHSKADQYSSLVLDNRGIGESDKPTVRYSTSEMAKDIVEVLDHIGWTEQRELHVIGISMGGMIAQELVRSVTFNGVIPQTSPSHNASCRPDLGCNAFRRSLMPRTSIKPSISNMPFEHCAQHHPAISKI
jgi:predicted alpha/beta hydrolase